MLVILLLLLFNMRLGELPIDLVCFLRIGQETLVLGGVIVYEDWLLGMSRDRSGHY